MSYHVKGWGIAECSESERLADDPRFRRASPLMLWAAAAIENLLKNTEKTWGDARTAYILASSYGELTLTTEFLRSLSLDGVARPMLFQSSLYNATIGFLSIHYQWRGPTFTLSNRLASSESALEMASTLMRSGLADDCLVIAMDEAVEYFQGAYLKIYDRPFVFKGGASVLWLSRNNKNARSSFELYPDEDQGRRLSELHPIEYSDTNVLLEVAKRLAKKQTEEDFIIPKPWGASVRVHWSV